MPRRIRVVTPMPVQAPPAMLEDRQTAAQAEATTAPGYRPKETEMILTFLYALGIAAVLGLPADYTWRRARQLAPFAAWPAPPPSSPLSPWPATSASWTARAQSSP